MEPIYFTGTFHDYATGAIHSGWGSCNLVGDIPLADISPSPSGTGPVSFTQISGSLQASQLPSLIDVGTF